jgi:nucleotide-binding universal stress UspA family protein
MIRTVVVPLDGSPLAETALEPAQRIAQRLHATLHLVRVLEPQVPSIDATGASVPEPRLEQDLRAETLAYLQALANGRSSGAGVKSTFALVDGPVVKALVEHVNAVADALVVMTTHGRTGLARVLLGSVTDSLVRSSIAPVLTIRVVGEKPSAIPIGDFRRVLIPLEGPYFGAEAIDPAVQVAGTSGPEYVLMTVVSPVPIIPPPEPPVPLPVVDVDAEASSAKNFLDTLAGPLQARGIEARGKVVIDGDPAQAILDFVNDGGVDLICMATHAYGGLKRLVFGSVAERVVRSATVPVLLMRPQQAAEATGR